MTFEMEVVRFDAQDVIATSGLLELPVGTAHTEHDGLEHIYVLGYEGNDLKVAWYEAKNGELALKTEGQNSGVQSVSNKSNKQLLGDNIGKWFYHTNGNWNWIMDGTLNGQ